VQFDVVFGRLIANCSRFRFHKTVTHTDQTTNAHTTISLSVSAARPSLHLEHRDITRQLNIEVIEGDRFEIEMVPLKAGQLPLGFTQQANNNVKLRIGKDETQQEIQAASLWHLLVEHKRLCETHLVPVLELMRPDWQLMDRVHQIENALSRVARIGYCPNRDRILELVEQLAAESFYQRQSALAELLDQGHSCLAILDSRDPRELTAEQRVRVRYVQDALRVNTPDTPERVAAWLSGDKSIWLTLLLDENMETRRLAQQQLVRICGRPISVDLDADPDDYSERVSQLKYQLGLR
jgi:hypothetical protein